MSSETSFLKNDRDKGQRSVLSITTDKGGKSKTHAKLDSRLSGR